MNDFSQIYEKDKIDEMYRQTGLSDDTIKLLKDYFDAFSNFYNVITLRDAYGIIRRQNGELVSEDEFIAFSEAARHDGKSYFYFILGKDEIYEGAPVPEVMDREIVQESLVMFNFEGYYDLADSQRGKPLYIPEREYLLRYADEYYYEHTPQTEALRDFFRNKMGMDNERTEDMVSECVFCIRYSDFPKENPVENVIEDFERMKIKFTWLQLDEFARLLAVLNNNTRHRCNRGFTPNELAARFGINDRISISAIGSSGASGTLGSGRKFKPSEIGLIDVERTGVRSDGKVGRNDPCPCGSGKKYKKCCGR